MPDLLEAPPLSEAPAPSTSRPPKRTRGGGSASPAKLRPPVPEAPAEPGPRRITVEEFHAMLDAGVFPGDGAGIELLDGFLSEKPMPKPAHSISVGRTLRTLQRALPDGWHVRVQDSVTFLTSEPLPDLVVVPGEVEDWGGGHPTGTDCAVLIEVSDSTLSLDRNHKARVYANAGVNPYWVVNLKARRVEVHDEPSPGDGTEENPPGYRRRDVSPGETLSFRAGDATIEFDAAELLPPVGES